MFGIFKKKETDESELEAACDNSIDRVKAYAAYKVLVDVMAMGKADEADLTSAIEEAISYLGEIMVD